MSSVQTQTHTASAVTAPHGRAGVTTARPIGLARCLIVCATPQRIRWFRRAAEGQGWETHIAMDADEAIHLASRERLQLAMIDLESLPTARRVDFRRVVERIADDGTTLLVVCNSVDDPSGEVWSRQLGAWMYLPGIDGQSDLDLICSEARIVVEKNVTTSVSS